MHKKAARSPWGRFILFFGILFAIIQIISYIPRQTSHQKNGNFWPYFYQEVPKNSLDIVFMGNSHSKTTFIPEVIDRLLGTHSIHVNTSGESIFQAMYEFREVLRRQNPKMVVLETNPIYNGLPRDELKPWNFSFFYSMPFSLRTLVYSHQFFTDSDLLKFYLPFTSTHANWKDPDAVISSIKEEFERIKTRLEPDWQLDLPHQGYENYLLSLPPSEAAQKSADGAGSCGLPDLETRLDAAEEILQISRERAQGLVLIEAPQFFNPYENCRDQVVAAAGSYGVQHHILLEGQTLSPLWFGDDEHMTQFGAIIASVETAQLLADQLGIDLNREALAYYQSYFFLGYTLVQEGDQIRLTLIPANQDAIQDVDFSWIISLNGESIMTIEETGGNELAFTLPEASGDYFINVIIHNPISSYYLRGGFDFVLE